MKGKVLDLDVNRFTSRFDLKLTFGKKRPGSLLVTGFFSEKKDNKFLNDNLVNDEFGSLSLISEEKTVYVSLGKSKDFDRKALLNISQQLVSLSVKKCSFDFDLSTFTNEKVTEMDVIDTFARTWYYWFHSPLHHKTTTKPKTKSDFHLLTTNQQTGATLKKIKIIFDAVSFCRNLQDEAPNLLNSETFAQLIKESFAIYKNVQTEILDLQTITKERMNLLLAVNAGSRYEPRVVVLKYFGNPDDSKNITVLLGKGITFDTGGYSLKPSKYQVGMKFDMSGAAITLSTLQAISKLGLKVNVVAIACLTDNVVDSKATLVESVIKSKSGKNVEITNTDAEGRLVLADGITYALEHIKPVQIIEMSTLTGAISITLGDWTTGAFVNSHGEKLYNDLLQAAKKVNESLWRLPVTKENLVMMKSQIADLVNASKDYKGASSNAAAFLFEFAAKTPFVHLDIAGTATKPENLLGTGVMIQTLVQYFENQAK